MKKYILLVIITVCGIAGTAYYLNSRNETNSVPAAEYASLAEQFLEKKEYSKALEQYKLAINADPSDTNSYIAAADIYLLKSKDQEALDLLINGEYSVASPDRLHYQIGSIFFARKDFESAKNYFQKAQNENHDNWENVVALVKTNSYFEDRQVSSKDALGQISSSEGDGFIYKNYYLALLSTDNPQSAQQFIANIDITKVADPTLQAVLERMTKAYEKIISDPDNLVQNNTLIAYELIQAELYKTALPLLETVIVENDEYYAAYMYSGVCYMKMDNYEEAQKQFETATTVDPEEIQPWVFLAQVYSHQNNQKSAIDAYERALTIDRIDETVRYDFAKTLKQFGLYQQASLEYIELIELASANVNKYKMELAFLYIDQLDKVSEGLEMIKSITEEWSDFKNATTEFQGEALDTLGWAYLKNDEKDQALKYLEQARDIYPYLASTYYHLGMLYKSIDSVSEATLAFERAIDLDLKGDISSQASRDLETLKTE